MGKHLTFSGVLGGGEEKKGARGFGREFEGGNSKCLHSVSTKEALEPIRSLT